MTALVAEERQDGLHLEQRADLARFDGDELEGRTDRKLRGLAPEAGHPALLDPALCLGFLLGGKCHSGESARGLHGAERGLS